MTILFLWKLKNFSCRFSMQFNIPYKLASDFDFYLFHMDHDPMSSFVTYLS